ncbi:MAG TPA: hypothetical protein EYP78_02725 [Candidatus Omnitrophica bacterium]|nr:hypothetical protein [Candidatus Omnitrophota bacterium]
MPKTSRNPTLRVRIPDKRRQELRKFCKKHGLIPGHVVERAIKEKLSELEEIEKRRELLTL